MGEPSVIYYPPVRKFIWITQTAILLGSTSSSISCLKWPHIQAYCPCSIWSSSTRILAHTPRTFQRSMPIFGCDATWLQNDGTVRMMTLIVTNELGWISDGTGQQKWRCSSVTSGDQTENEKVVLWLTTAAITSCASRTGHSRQHSFIDVGYDLCAALRMSEMEGNEDEDECVAKDQTAPKSAGRSAIFGGQLQASHSAASHE